jgi:hypothetical protein
MARTAGADLHLSLFPVCSKGIRLPPSHIFSSLVCLRTSGNMGLSTSAEAVQEPVELIRRALSSLFTLAAVIFAVASCGEQINYPSPTIIQPLAHQHYCRPASIHSHRHWATVRAGLADSLGWPRGGANLIHGCPYPNGADSRRAHRDRRRGSDIGGPHRNRAAAAPSPSLSPSMAHQALCRRSLPSRPPPRLQERVPLRPRYRYRLCSCVRQLCVNGVSPGHWSIRIPRSWSRPFRVARFLPSERLTFPFSIRSPTAACPTWFSFRSTVPSPVLPLSRLPAPQWHAVSETVTLTGSGFYPGSVVYFNGMPLTTTFSSNTTLTAAVPPGNLGLAGVFGVQVFNTGTGGGFSNALSFAVNATSLGLGLPAACGSGTQRRAGQQRRLEILASSGPSIAGTGEFVAFASISTNLVANDTNGASDVYVRDTCAGSSSCVPKTVLASVSSSGAQGNGASLQPSLESSGRYVAFSSVATNLDPNFPTVNGTTQQVYIRDTTTTPPATMTPVFVEYLTSLVSVAADGVSPANADANSPAISPDGRFVAFVSAATNLVTAIPTNGIAQVYLRDTCLGFPSEDCTPTTYMVSSPNGITAGNAASSQPSVSTDAQYVSFTSTASNLVGGLTPTASQIFLRELCTSTHHHSRHQHHHLQLQRRSQPDFFAGRRDPRERCEFGIGGDLRRKLLRLRFLGHQLGRGCCLHRPADLYAR